MPDWVLIIDDDPAIVQVLSEQIERAGFTTTSASDAMQGVIQAETLVPSLVILDMMMPGFGGGDVVLKKLRSHPRLKGVPILVLTGMAPERARRIVGADRPDLRLFFKPPKWADLVAAVRQMARSGQA